MSKKKAEEEVKEVVAVYAGEDTSEEEVEPNDAGSGDETGLAIVGEDTTEAPDEAEYEFKDLRRRVMSLRAKTDESYWDLAVALEDVYERGCYRAWGFESWKDYVENEIDIHIRKAQFLVQIQKWINEMKPNVQAWIRAMGWTKARMLISVITAENAREWKARLDGKTVAEIDKMLKEMKAAKDESESAGGADSSEDKPKSVNFKLFPLQLDNWTRAAELAMGPAESDKPGNLLDLICTDYIASNMTIRSIGDLLGKYEKTLGVRLVAYDEKKDRVVYGEDLIRQLDEEEPEDVEADVDGEDVEAEETTEKPVVLN